MGKRSAFRPVAVGETAVSLHHGAPWRVYLNLLRSSEYYHIEGVLGDPYFGPYCAERGYYLGQWLIFFSVWLRLITDKNIFIDP